MNILEAKSKARIIAGIAAFFVIATLGFSFEPLVSLVERTKNMPAETTAYLTLAPSLKPKGDFFEGIMRTIPPTHDWTANIDLLNKLKGLVFDSNILTATVQDNSVAISSASKPGPIIANIRRFLSKLTPFEVKTVLPDQTSMTEIVIDPGLVKVATDNETNPSVWTFAQTNPQLVISKNSLNTNILINYPQIVDNLGYEYPTNCSVSSSGIKTVSLNTARQTLFLALFKGLSAYLRHYSCFQSFSTFTHHS